MSLKSVIIILLAAVILVTLFSQKAKAQAAPPPPELADQIDSFYDRASTPANRQKFLSIIIFLFLGGAATYCVMRGIKKVVAMY